MKWIKALLGFATVAVALVGCGGGGSNSGSPVFGGPAPGSGGNTTGTVTLSLRDQSGNTIAPPALTGTQNATAVATVKDSSSQPVAGALVGFTGDGLTFSPASGQAITDANGVARVQVSASDPFAGGATTISAATTVGSTQVQSTLAVALGAATSSLGTMTTSGATVNAYQTLQVSVPVTLSGTNEPAVQYPVSFSASCGTFDPASTLSGANGVAQATYRNQAGSTACSGNVLLTATAGSASTTTTVTAIAPQPANIQFLQASPARIYLTGSPGLSQSIVSFKVVDSGGNPVSGQTVQLAMTLRPTGAYLGTTPNTITLQQSSGSDGSVSVAVNSGTAPGPVQIEATLVSDPTIKNVSNTLAVASGLPVQRAFSLSVSTFNIEGWDQDGVTTTLTMRIADRLGNPVPDGTTVNFISEGGQVVASCNTTGAAANNTSACSVTLSSQNVRPSDGRVTVLAWAQGEESFTDAGNPTNNIFDAGESFQDLGQPYLDVNENGVFNAGQDVTVGTASGSQACPAGSESATQSVPGTCDGSWGRNLVRASTVIVFSGSEPTLKVVSPMAGMSGGRCGMTITLEDLHGNPLPADTALSVSGVSGGGAPDASFEGFGDSGDKVPNTNRFGPTQHSIVFSKCSSPAGLSFTLSVTTPTRNVTRKFFLP